jgi:hypothetical protein
VSGSIINTERGVLVLTGTDTQKITVKMTDREAAWPTDEWSYRIDKLCDC